MVIDVMPTNKYLFIAPFIAFATDFGITLTMLNKGHSEGNPLVATDTGGLNLINVLLLFLFEALILIVASRIKKYKLLPLASFLITGFHIFAINYWNKLLFLQTYPLLFFVILGLYLFALFLITKT